MKKLFSYLLVLTFLGLGTGTLEYLHNLQHAAEDARQDAIAAASGKPSQEHHHDESNCTVHAQLHMPGLVGGWVSLLAELGLLHTVRSLPAIAMIPRELPSRMDCRGPPAAEFPLI